MICPIFKFSLFFSLYFPFISWIAVRNFFPLRGFFDSAIPEHLSQFGRRASHKIYLQYKNFEKPRLIGLFTFGYDAHPVAFTTGCFFQGLSFRPTYNEQRLLIIPHIPGPPLDDSRRLTWWRARRTGYCEDWMRVLLPSEIECDV